MIKGVVVSLFDYTGVMVQPWAKAGYDCYIIDIEHPDGISNQDENTPHSITRIGADLTYSYPDILWILPNIKIVFAFPPCDHLAVTGARWFKGKGLRKLASSINMFATATEFCEKSGAPYLIENPVSTISTYWRKSDVTFDPCDYGEPYTKKTCIWYGGGFKMPVREYVVPHLGSKIHEISPGNKRKVERSRTPVGFANAVFKANN